MMFKDAAHERRVLGAAITLATLMHSATDALYAGRPYILHPLRVMETVGNRSIGSTAMIVAVLHDTLEDTSLTAAEMKAAGIPERLISAVEALTRDEGEFYMDYIDRVKQDKLAMIVKLADIEDHLAHSATLADSRRDRYLRARRHLKGA